MRIAATITVTIGVGVITVTTGCRLDPLVDDKPGASSHLLPPGTTVPSAIENNDLKVQITLNDGLDDATLAMTNKGVVVRGTGMSADMPVSFWSFGPATRAPSPIYEFFKRIGLDQFERIPHLPLLDALPGDHGYSPLHGINRVVVTDAYAGELITTMDALADAIDLGLVEEPVPLKMFVDTPIVLPSTKLEVGLGNAPADPEIMYARGYTVTAFRFGGPLGEQPTGPLLLPTSQVSFLREPQGTYNAMRPIFQATIPTSSEPPSIPGCPPRVTNYTPLSVVVNVDLVSSVAGTITKDSDLFTRSSCTGEITGTTAAVAAFQVTTSLQLLQLQFADGAP